MISKKTAQRVKEIDFISILNSEEGKRIRVTAEMASVLAINKTEKFISAAAAYNGNLLSIPAEKMLKELEKDSYLIAWINSCLLAKRNELEGLEIMLAGIYQFNQWEKENALST